MRERTSYSQAEGCRFDCTRRPLLVTVPCCVAITNVLSFVTCRVGGPFRTWQVVLGLFGVGLLFRALPDGRGREPGTLLTTGVVLDRSCVRVVREGGVS